MGASVATYTWQNGVSGDWSSAADWTPNGVPGSGDTAEIAAGAAFTLTATGVAVAALLMDAGTLSVNGLFDANDLLSVAGGALEVQAGGTVATAGLLFVGAQSGPPGAATLAVQGGATVAAAGLAVYNAAVVDIGGGAVSLGNAGPAAGALTVGANATLTSDSGTIDGNVVDDGLLSVVPVLAGETAGVVTVNGTLDDNGAVTIASIAALAVGGDLILAAPASLLIDAGSALAVAGSLAISGTLDAPAGAYEIVVQGALAVAQQAYGVSVGAGQEPYQGGTFDVAGAPVTAGSFAFAGVEAITGGTLRQSGTAAAVVSGGSLSLGGGASWTAPQLVVGVNQWQYLATSATLDVADGSVAVAGTVTVGAEVQASTPSGGGPANLDGNDGAVGSLVVGPGGSVGATGLVLQSGLDAVSTVVVSGTGMIVLGTAAGVAGAVVVGGDGTITASSGAVQADMVLNGLLIETPGASGAGDLVITGSLTGQGTIDAAAASFTVLTGFDNTPSTYTDTATVEVGTASGFTGGIALHDATLILDTATTGGTITGGGTVDLRGLAYESYAVPLYDAATGILSVGGETLDVGLGHATGDFTTQYDGTAGTDVLIAAIPCYAAGTGIATPGGDVAVEALRPGDAVLTPDGPRPVRWVGRFTVDLDRHPAPHHAAPIRIRADAVAPGIPARDVRLSPDHAVLVGGALMQAQALVNGATILREPSRGRVTYCHVELDRHAILFAEGLPAESYLDTGNRAAFSGECGVRPLFPDLTARAWTADACAPLLLDGPAVAAAHARLLARARTLFHLTADPALTVRADGVPVPLRRDGPLAWRARLRAGARAVRLRSRSFVPNDLGADDRRRLGVAVTALSLDGQPLAPDDDGWHAAEDGWRWTDGDAGLRLDHCPRPRWLRIAAADAGARYWLPAARRVSAEAAA